MSYLCKEDQDKLKRMRAKIEEFNGIVDIEINNIFILLTKGNARGKIA